MKEIQSLSITVPTGGCLNNCKYCVSKMHCDSWIKDRFKGKQKALKTIVENLKLKIELNKVVCNTDRWDWMDFDVCNDVKAYELIKYELQDFYERLKFARDNGINTVILTGVDGEILQNKSFLKLFNILNNLLPDPFIWIEAQTSGVLLEDETLWETNPNLTFLKDIGVKTISLSISDIFDEDSNAEITEIPKKLRFNLDALCKRIKEMNFNLRLSLNLSDVYNDNKPEDFFDRASQLDADQITFRELYTSEIKCKENDWIEEHRMHPNMMSDIKRYILDNGRFIGILTFGAKQYGVNGVSTVIDDNCMSEKVKETLKYIILRENLKLYSRWNLKSSLLY